MYDLPYHKETDEREISNFIARHPFAFLTGCDAENRPVVTQVPILMHEQDDRKLLRGHFMRGTDHHEAFAHNRNVLAVFSGHHAYVSGTWYSDPCMASTWNYMSVHVRGRMRFLDDDGLEAVLRQTSLHFEDHDHESPTVFDNLPDDFKRKVMGAIVGFEIEVVEMDNVFKLSQDRDAASYLNIIKELRARGESGRAIAAEMEKRMDGNQ